MISKLSNYKKAQTTIFIILAVVIIAAAIGLYFITNSSTQSNLEKSFSTLGIITQASLVQSSIFSCLEDTSRASLDVIGIQGGYYNKPAKHFDLGWAFIPYYYDQGQFLKPTTQEIESELSSYIDENLEFCIQELNYEDFTLTHDQTTTKTSIQENTVKFTIDSKLLIKKDTLSSEFTLSNHPIEIESALSDILKVADYITESHREDPDLICISCVSDMAETRNLFVDMLDFDEDTTTLVVISEDHTYSEPYIFEFLNRYPA
jgi:hypothetical protein|tara:strand:- start:63 stop:848 length:786 start_codon:yes stop_codon:yes gene_type:complete